MSTPPAQHRSLVDVRPPWRWRAAVAGLAVLLAGAFAFIGILVGEIASARHDRSALACQVQRLGGSPVGGVHCPPRKHPAPAPAGSTSPAPAAPSPSSTIVLVLPPASGTVTQSPTSARSSSRPASRPAAPAPSPSRSSTPAPGRCVQVLVTACLPPTVAPR